MNNHKQRACIRCKVSKVLNGYVFRKTNSTIGLAPSFDRVCIHCRKIESSEKQNKKRKGLVPKNKKCKYRKCTNTIKRVGFKFYCSDKCRRLENILKAKDERDKVNQFPRRKIEEKFLTRGKVTYEGYRCL